MFTDIDMHRLQKVRDGDDSVSNSHLQVCQVALCQCVMTQKEV